MKKASYYIFVALLLATSSLNSQVGIDFIEGIYSGVNTYSKKPCYTELKLNVLNYTTWTKAPRFSGRKGNIKTFYLSGTIRTYRGKRPKGKFTEYTFIASAQDNGKVVYCTNNRIGIAHDSEGNELSDYQIRLPSFKFDVDKKSVFIEGRGYAGDLQFEAKKISDEHLQKLFMQVNYLENTISHPKLHNLGGHITLTLKLGKYDDYKGEFSTVIKAHQGPLLLNSIDTRKLKLYEREVNKILEYEASEYIGIHPSVNKIYIYNKSSRNKYTTIGKYPAIEIKELLWVVTVNKEYGRINFSMTRSPALEAAVEKVIARKSKNERVRKEQLARIQEEQDSYNQKQAKRIGLRNPHVIGFVQDKQGNEYGVVQIKDKLWLADNLNYSQNQYGLCYRYNQRNCQSTARLYSYEEATNVCQSLGVNWRLPTRGDWAYALEVYDNEEVNHGYEPELNRKLFYKAKEDGFLGLNLKLGGSLKVSGSNSNFFSYGATGYYWTKSKTGVIKGTPLEVVISEKMEALYLKDVRVGGEPDASFYNSVRCVSDNLADSDINLQAGKKIRPDERRSKIIGINGESTRLFQNRKTGNQFRRRGVTITKIYESLPADNYGLKVGDIVVSINRILVDSISEISSELMSSKNEVIIHFMRDGLLDSIKVKPFQQD